MCVVPPFFDVLGRYNRPYVLLMYRSFILGTVKVSVAWHVRICVNVRVYAFKNPLVGSIWATCAARFLSSIERRKSPPRIYIVRKYCLSKENFCILHFHVRTKLISAQVLLWNGESAKSNVSCEMYAYAVRGEMHNFVKVAEKCA